jgi:dolichol-phosphate mannosyltransferase
MEAAMNAGRDLAVGDFLLEFDQCTFDFEEDLIMAVYRRALQGYDVVAAAPLRGVALSSRLFYFVYNLGSRRKTRMRQERFRIVSRRAVNRVNQLNSYIPYRKALYMNCGLKIDTLTYENAPELRRTHSRQEMGSRSNIAMDTIIIFTDILEKLSMILSIIFFLVLVVMAGDVVYSMFSETKPVEGWLSLMGLMSLGFFMLFVMLTLISKYLSVLLNMMFKRQRYVVEGIQKL